MDFLDELDQTKRYMLTLAANINREMLNQDTMFLFEHMVGH